jgi:hypothetical protein
VWLEAPKALRALVGKAEGRNAETPDAMKISAGMTASASLRTSSEGLTQNRPQFEASNGGYLPQPIEEANQAGSMTIATT